MRIAARIAELQLAEGLAITGLKKKGDFLRALLFLWDNSPVFSYGILASITDEPIVGDDITIDLKLRNTNFDNYLASVARCILSSCHSYTRFVYFSSPNLRQAWSNCGYKYFLAANREKCISTPAEKPPTTQLVLPFPTPTQLTCVQDVVNLGACLQKIFKVEPQTEAIETASVKTVTQVWPTPDETKRIEIKTQNGLWSIVGDSSDRRIVTIHGTIGY